MVPLMYSAYYRVRNGPHADAILLAAIGTVCLAGLPLLTFAGEGWRFSMVTLGIGAVSAVQLLTLTILARLRAKVNDVHYAVSLEPALQRAGYVVKDFFTDEAAANPSLQLEHVKILALCAPRSILELGSGQTTKVLSSYVRNHPSAYALTLEQDADWFNRVRPQVVHHYRHAPLAAARFTCSGSGQRIETSWYADVPELASRKFDYVLVDGPDPGTRGTEHIDLARSGILQHMPSILADSFVVLFDDAERYGEHMTVDALAHILDAREIPYVRFLIHGVKTQAVVCSPDRAFLRST